MDKRRSGRRKNVACKSIEPGEELYEERFTLPPREYSAGNAREGNKENRERAALEPQRSPSSPSVSKIVINTTFGASSRRVSAAAKISGRECLSCGTRTTPYWRDSWEPIGVLCNACGLRFQKLLLRCPACS